jgi:hypothetical protein
MFPPAASTYKNNIFIPIAVLPPLIAGTEPRLVCPAFLVPLGDWLIVWNLVTINYPQIAHAVFTQSDGIEPKPGLSFTSSKRISDTQWVTSFKNSSTEAVIETILAAYVINFDYPMPTAENPNAIGTFSSTNRKVISHDPTIVITHDPIEPP